MINHTTTVILQSSATVSTLAGEVAASKVLFASLLSSQLKRSISFFMCIGFSVLGMTGLPFSTNHFKDTCGPVLLCAAPMEVTSVPLASSVVPQGPQRGEKDMKVMLWASQKDFTPSGSGPMPTCHSCWLRAMGNVAISKMSCNCCWQ